MINRKMYLKMIQNIARDKNDKWKHMITIMKSNNHKQK